MRLIKRNDSLAFFVSVLPHLSAKEDHFIAMHHDELQRYQKKSSSYLSEYTVAFIIEINSKNMETSFLLLFLALKVIYC